MKKSFIILFALYLTFSCEKSNNEPKIKQDVIQPLEVGYYWEFIDSTFSETGLLERVDTSKVGITGKSLVQYDSQELELYHWSWYNKGLHDYSSIGWLCSNTTEGLNHYGGIIDNKLYVIVETLNVKYPVNVNESWERIDFRYLNSNDTSYFYIADTSTCTCVSINKSLQTSIGNLNCYVHVYNNDNGINTDEIYIYHTLNIGYVGSIIIRDGFIRLKRTLLDYSLTKSSGN